MNKVILFGASGTGKIAYQFYHEKAEILFWIDNDASKWGSKLKELDIYSPEKLLEGFLDHKIVITSNYHEEIKAQLIAMGAQNIQIFNVVIEPVYEWDVNAKDKLQFLSIGEFLKQFSDPILFRELSMQYGGSTVLDYALLRGLVLKYNLKNYLEIGTYIGDSLKIVSDICEKCYSISVPPDHPSSMKNWCLEKGMIDYTGFLVNEKNMIQYLCDSKEFNYKEIPSKIDLFFIDGDHSYEGVFADTQKIWDIADRENAFIVWHDCKRMGKPNFEVLSVIRIILQDSFKDFYLFDNNNMCGIYIPNKYRDDFSKEIDFYTYELTVKTNKY